MRLLAFATFLIAYRFTECFEKPLKLEKPLPKGDLVLSSEWRKCSDTEPLVPLPIPENSKNSKMLEGNLPKLCPMAEDKLEFMHSMANAKPENYDDGAISVEAQLCYCKAAAETQCFIDRWCPTKSSKAKKGTSK